MHALTIHQAAPEGAQWELDDGPELNVAAELPEDIAALCAQGLRVRSWWAAHEHTIEGLTPAATSQVRDHIVMGAAARAPSRTSWASTWTSSICNSSTGMARGVPPAARQA
jgi:hypothetical protein